MTKTLRFRSDSRSPDFRFDNPPNKDADVNSSRRTVSGMAFSERASSVFKDDDGATMNSQTGGIPSR